MKYLHQFVTTNLNVGGGIDDSQTTGIVLQSLNNIDATKPSVACLTWADPLDTSVAEWITYTSVNSTTNELQGVTRGAEGYSAKSHLNQAVIAFPLSKSHVNDLNTAVSAEHSTAGVHSVSAMISGGSVLDEDNMASNSATALATQQSIKAYVDSKTSSNNLYQQAIINGNFDVWQRGTTVSPSASGTFIADRWELIYDADGGTLPTDINRRATLTAGDVFGSYFAFELNVDGAGSSLGNGSYYWHRQKIENGVRNMCGASKTVTLSFWAKSDITNKKIGVFLQQYYGSGGTPTSIETINGTNWTLTSTWTKYTHTFTTNTLSGKTFGTAHDDYLTLSFMHQWGSTYQARAGASGAESFVGSGSVYITQVQLCAGSVALPFQPKSYLQELADCQRYCVVYSPDSTYSSIGLGTASSTTAVNTFVHLPVEIRVTPALIVTASDFIVSDGASSAAVSDMSLYATESSKKIIELRSTSTGLTQFRPYALLFNNKSGTEKLILSAEL